MSWAIVWLVGLDMGLRAVLLLHDVVLIGHKYGVVAWIGKLLPVIDVMDLDSSLIERWHPDHLAAWHV